MSIKYSTPSKEKVEFLTSRSWYTNKHNELNIILNNIAPESHIVAANDNIELNLDFSKCEFFSSNVNPLKIIKMKDSYCHDNCEKLYKLGIISEIYTGYALSTDGLWRFHSWGFNNEEILIETTESRIYYYGMNLFELLNIDNNIF